MAPQEHPSAAFSVNAHKIHPESAMKPSEHQMMSTPRPPPSIDTQTRLNPTCEVEDFAPAHISVHRRQYLTSVFKAFVDDIPPLILPPSIHDLCFNQFSSPIEPLPSLVLPPSIHDLQVSQFSSPENLTSCAETDSQVRAKSE